MILTGFIYAYFCFWFWRSNNFKIAWHTDLEEGARHLKIIFSLVENVYHFSGYHVFLKMWLKNDSCETEKHSPREKKTYLESLEEFSEILEKCLRKISGDISWWNPEGIPKIILIISSGIFQRFLLSTSQEFLKKYFWRKESLNLSDGK